MSLSSHWFLYTKQGRVCAAIVTLRESSFRGTGQDAETEGPGGPWAE